MDQSNYPIIIIFKDTHESIWLNNSQCQQDFCCQQRYIYSKQNAEKLKANLKMQQAKQIITRNAVIVLYVLLECLKWISTLLSLAIVAYP